MPALRVTALLLQNAPSSGSGGAPFGTVRTVAVSPATARRCAGSTKLHLALCADRSTGDRVHRPVPGLPAGWFRLLAIARLLSPSITNYTSTTKVQVQKLNIYEMVSSLSEFLMAWNLPTID